MMIVEMLAMEDWNMKNCQKTVAIMMVFITIVALLPVSAFASYKVEPLRYNYWYSLKEDVSTVYRVKVTADTIFTVNWKNNRGESYVAVYPDKECDESSIYRFLDSGYSISSGTDGMVLYRGTYYILMGDYDNKAKVKFSKKPNTINKQNYCISKAITMTKNKKYEYSQSKSINYKRWYKIKLTKSQEISIVGYDSEYGITLYDSNFNRINCKYSEKNRTITTRGKQPKGIYYLALNEDDLDYLMDKGYYYSIYWK